MALMEACLTFYSVEKGVFGGHLSSLDWYLGSSGVDGLDVESVAFAKQASMALYPRGSHSPLPNRHGQPRAWSV